MSAWQRPRRPARRLGAGGPEAVQRIARGARAAAARERLALRRTQRAVAPRVRAESLGPAGHARGGGRRRLRDRERRAQGERDLPRASRFGRRAGAAHQSVRAWARATVTAGAPPAWSGISCRSPASAPETGAACSAVLDALRRGFGTTRIVERHRLRADSAWPAWLTPEGVVWETWRGMGWPLTIAWLAWTWLLWAAAAGDILNLRSSTPDQPMPRARFLGTGLAVPDRVVTNDDLSRADGHQRRMDPHPDRHPGAALGSRGRDRARGWRTPPASRAIEAAATRARRARRDHLRDVDPRPLRARQRRLPAAPARRRRRSPRSTSGTSAAASCTPSRWRMHSFEAGCIATSWWWARRSSPRRWTSRRGGATPR